MREFVVAVVGATGAVGEEMIDVLGELNFPVSRLVPLASERSVGKEVEFRGKSVKVLELTESVFQEQGIEIALFSAGGSISAKFAEHAAKAGAVVIDNTSHFRMDSDVPLVVPEVNPEDISLWRKKGIIANPNCSTIQMVQALKPLDELFDIERVDVSTYQAVSGAGKSAMETLVTQMQDFFAFRLSDSDLGKFPHQIALNLIPQIDSFTDNGYTKEELKMVNETKKIMHKDIKVSATCVRVPVLKGHSESITVRFNNEVDLAKAREAINNGKNLVLLDEPKSSVYPMPIIATDKNDTFIGRMRLDVYEKNILHFFCVADNLRVGAATNAVRIAQKWVEMGEYN